MNDYFSHPYLAIICRQICRWSPTFCKTHSSCDRYAHGEDHRGQGCECKRVQYEEEL